MINCDAQPVRCELVFLLFLFPSAIAEYSGGHALGSTQAVEKGGCAQQS